MAFSLLHSQEGCFDSFHVSRFPYRFHFRSGRSFIYLLYKSSLKKNRYFYDQISGKNRNCFVLFVDNFMMIYYNNKQSNFKMGDGMTEFQIDQYLHRLETMTVEYQWSQRKGCAYQPPARAPGEPWILRAKGCFDGEPHLIHIKKHSDCHVGDQPPPHSHDFFEFNFVCKGYCHNIVDGKDLFYGTDTLLLMNPYASHICWVEDIGSQVVNLLIRPEAIENVFISLMSADDPMVHFFLDSLYGQSQMPGYMLFHIDEAVTDIFWHMVNEFISRPPLYQQMILSDTLRLFAELIRQNPIPLTPDTKEGTRLSDILNYMIQNYSTVTLEKLSDVFHYSPTYISRILKTETGKSFSETLKDYRLSRACNFLKNSNISADAISEIIGYSNVSYFYKIFKRELHMNPSEYRKKYLSKH